MSAAICGRFLNLCCELLLVWGGVSFTWTCCWLFAYLTYICQFHISLLSPCTVTKHWRLDLYFPKEKQCLQGSKWMVLKFLGSLETERSKNWACVEKMRFHWEIYLKICLEGKFWKTIALAFFCLCGKKSTQKKCLKIAQKLFKIIFYFFAELSLYILSTDQPLTY